MINDSFEFSCNLEKKILRKFEIIFCLNIFILFTADDDSDNNPHDYDGTSDFECSNDETRINLTSHLKYGHNSFTQMHVSIITFTLLS